MADTKSTGTIDKALDTVKSIADKFFNFLSNLDSDPALKKRISKVKEKETNGKTKSKSYYVDKVVPITEEWEYVKDGVFNIKFYISDSIGQNNPVVYKNQKVGPSGDIDSKIRLDAYDKLITPEVKQEFGIKSSKQLNVRLHRIVGSKQDTVMLTGIDANAFTISDAESMLNTALSNDDFINVLTETPTDYSIVEVDDSFEISDCDPDDYIDYIESAIQAVMCATLGYYMEMQTLDWSAARDKELHDITSSLLWRAQDNIRFFGDLCIELLDKVFNPFICSASFSGLKDYALGEVTKEDIRSAILRYVDVMEFYSCNFTSDVASSIDCMVRDLKHIADFDLKMD